MKEPTQVECEGFLRWCGCRPDEIDASTWVCPDGGRYSNYSGLPTIDLDFLFKYAVPIAIDKIMAEQECSCEVAYAILFKKWLQKLELDIPNHERTLFYAIQEVIHDR